MDNFSQQVFALVYQVPKGKIATYGDIATLAGMSSYARQVGKVLSRLPADSQLPWHRIINAKGKISLLGERGNEQKQRLIDEGITISEHGTLSLKTYRYNPSPRSKFSPHSSNMY